MTISEKAVEAAARTLHERSGATSRWGEIQLLNDSWRRTARAVLEAAMPFTLQDGGLEHGSMTDKATAWDAAAEKNAEIARLRAVADAARRMPRATPAPGAACTVHKFEIEASTVWELDRALKKLDAAHLIAENGEK